MFQIRNFLANGFAGVLASAAFLHIPAAAAATERVVYSFCSLRGCTDGGSPQAGLIEVGALLYGTTLSGGANNDGTVFSVNPGAGVETVIHAFQDRGMDGSNPIAGLVNVHGTLYGTTSNGGTGLGLSSTYGTVFSINPRTDRETVVYSFCSQGGSQCTDGARPFAGLISAGGILYGTTEIGGVENCGVNNGCGTVFSLDPGTGAQTVLHTFQYNSSDGQTPYGGLINVGGILYGTTVVGGGGINCAVYGCGAVFTVDPKTGAESVVHAFPGNGTDGQNPWAGLVSVGGLLYGTTGHGGANYGKGEGGTVFTVNPKTGAETVIYSFCSLKNCADGAAPYAGLINVHGLLYGTTAGGGSKGCDAAGCGTVFSIDPSTGAENVLYAFQNNSTDSTDGFWPKAGLVNIRGTLYGTTESGGSYGRGTVFAVTP